jgi:hypothetical protein
VLGAQNREIAVQAASPGCGCCCPEFAAACARSGFVFEPSVQGLEVFLFSPYFYNDFFVMFIKCLVKVVKVSELFYLFDFGYRSLASVSN